MKDTAKLMEKHSNAWKEAESLDRIGDRVRKLKLPPETVAEAQHFDQILADLQKQHAILQGAIDDVRDQLAPLLQD